MVIKSLYYHLYVVDEMEKLILCNGPLDVNSINAKWFNEFKNSNYGAIITFNGVVRR